MPASVTITPNTIYAKATASMIAVDNADENDISLYDPEIYPSSPEITYKLQIVDSGTDAVVGESYVFSTNADGKHTFMDYEFPYAGTFCVYLVTVDGDPIANSGPVTVFSDI